MCLSSFLFCCAALACRICKGSSFFPTVMPSARILVSCDYALLESQVLLHVSQNYHGPKDLQFHT
uniref:Secreted protein n=1 Tax=Arundo donax TaxID=35708 RepID=A0A0A9AGX9_ARUDO